MSFYRKSVGLIIYVCCCPPLVYSISSCLGTILLFIPIVCFFSLLYYISVSPCFIFVVSSSFPYFPCYSLRFHPVNMYQLHFCSITVSIGLTSSCFRIVVFIVSLPLVTHSIFLRNHISIAVVLLLV